MLLENVGALLSKQEHCRRLFCYIQKAPEIFTARFTVTENTEVFFECVVVILHVMK